MNGEKRGNIDLDSIDLSSIIRDISQESSPEQASEAKITTGGKNGRRSLGEFSDEALLSEILPSYKQELPQYYEQPVPERETLGQTIGRNILGVGQSIASVLGGLPGSILSLPTQLAETLAEKIGFPLREPEKFESEKWGIPKEEYLKTLRQYQKALPPGIPGIVESPLDVGLPTVPGIKKGIEEVGETVFGISPELWKPKTATEKTGREYIERVTGLLHPALWPVSFGKALIAPLVGFGGKQGAKLLGLGDFWQNVVGTVGETAFLGWDPASFREKMKTAYDKARSFLINPKSGVFAVNTKPITNLISFPKKFVRNINDPTKAEQWILDRINGLIDEIMKGGQKIDVGRLWELKKSFGKHASEFKGRFKDISRFVKETNDTLDKMIQQYGKKYNPQFLKEYNKANDVFQAFQGSKASKFLSSIDKAIEKRGDIISLGIAGGFFGLGSLGKALVGLKIAKTATEAYKLLKNSPTVRKFYLKGMAAATKQNVKAAINYFEKADEALEKKFPGIKEAVFQQQKI